FVVPEPDHSIAAGVEELRSLGVVGLALSVLAAIELDDQCSIATDEICGVRADLVLAAELEAEQAAGAQMEPEPSFRVGLVGAETSLEGVVLLAAHGDSPLTPALSPLRGAREKCSGAAFSFPLRRRTVLSLSPLRRRAVLFPSPRFCGE